MADRIKGITIEINGDTTDLSKALSAVNKDIKSTQTQLKDVEKLLKLDPTNTQLLEQRQRLLAQAVQETKKKLDTLKEAEKQAQEQFAKGEISQEQYDALQREIVSTEQELGRLEKSAANANATMQHIAAVTKEVSEKTGEFADKTRGLSTAAAGAVAALGSMAAKAISSADDLNALAQKTGFSTDELQKMQYAADRVDTSMESVTGAASRLKRNLTSTSSTVTSAFSRLGVSVTDANGELRDSTEIFWEVIAGLSEIENETERDTVAMALFGKGADELAGIIDDGGAAFRSYGKEAEQLGLILSQDTLDGLNEVNDELDKLKAQSQALIAVNGAKIVQAFLPLIQELSNGAGALAEKISSLDEKQIKTIGTAAALIATVSPVAGIISKITSAASGLMGALPGLFALISAHPLGAALTAVTGVAAVLTTIALASRDTSLDLAKLTTEARQLDKVMSDGAKTLNSNTDKINAAAGAARSLVKRLEDLEQQDLSNAGAAQEYASVVSALNELYPELNLQIDENTGLVKDGTAAIYESIEALREQYYAQALQAHYTEVLEQWGKAQAELAINEYRLAAAQRELDDLMAESADLTKRAQEAELALNDAVMRYGKNSQEAADAQREWQRVSQELYVAQMKGADATNEARKKVASYTDAVATARKTLEPYQDAVDEAAAVLREMTEATEDGAEATEGMGEKAADTTDELADLAAGYTTVLEKARSSINGQVKLFDDFAAKLSEDTDTIEEILEIWARQTQNLAAYTENLRKAAEYGIDEGLVAALSDGSAESATYLAIIIQAVEDAAAGTSALGDTAEEAVERINEAFRGTAEAKEALAETVTGISSVAEDMKRAGVKAGSNYTAGLIEGLLSNSAGVSSAAQKTSENIINKGKSTLKISSPSKVAREIGAYWDEGIVEGLYAGARGVADASQDVAATIMQSAPVTNNAVVNNSNTTTNTGGIYVTVNGAPGQDVQQLAEAVMEEIQAAVEREGAAL